MIPCVVIVLYLFATVLIGLLTKRADRASDYEGHLLGLGMCVAIGAGEWMGGTSTTGVSEYGYLFGLSGAWYTIANGIGICFLAVFFAKLFRNLNSSTVPEIIGAYLGKKARMVSSVILILVLMIVGASQMISIGTLGQALLNLSPTASICILGFGVMLYTCAGGMNAIGVTNALHLAVMYVGVILALVSSTLSIGSLSDKLPPSYFSPLSIGSGRVLSWIIASVLGACTAQAGLQPILKSKDWQTAVRSSFLIALIVAPFGIFTALLGMYAKARFPALENAKLALPSLLMTMNPWMSGVVMAAIIAAVLSTASPIFLSCGTLMARDLYCELIRKEISDKTLLCVSRAATLLSGSACILLATALSGSATILDIVYFAYSLRGSLFVTLLLGIFWKRMTSFAALLSMGMTAATGIFWVAYQKATGAYPIPFLTETYASILTTLVVGIAASLLSADRRMIRKEATPLRKSIVERVKIHASERRDKPAVITAQRTVRYGELYEAVKGYAKYLMASGLKKGDIVLLRASQTAEFVVIYLAVHHAGGVVASLEKTISDKAMIEVAEQLQAKIILRDNADLQYHAIYLPRSRIFETAMEHLDDPWELSLPNLEDSADILFTTGTTGRSKGVELSHKALAATVENLIFGCEYQKDTVMLIPGPLNHANAIRKLFTSLANGSAAYPLNGMTDIKAFYQAIETGARLGRVACCLPPAAIRMLFRLTGDKLGEYANVIDFIETATAPLPEPDKLRLCSLLPHTRLYNNYGSSESASVCIYDYNRFPNRENCVGRVMPNAKIVIVDDDRREMQSSKDNVGLIACIGDVNMKGYVNDPVMTRRTLTGSTVFTNDVGYIGEDGFVYVTGRQDDVINVGGLKVAPSEVESAALSYPAIQDCVCIAVDDSITTNALKLLVVLRGDEELDKKGIRNCLREKLEAYKVPALYEKVERIERTYNGKLNRKFYRTEKWKQKGDNAMSKTMSHGSIPPSPPRRSN